MLKLIQHDKDGVLKLPLFSSFLELLSFAGQSIYPLSRSRFCYGLSGVPRGPTRSIAWWVHPFNLVRLCSTTWFDCAHQPWFDCAHQPWFDCAHQPTLRNRGSTSSPTAPTRQLAPLQSRLGFLLLRKSC